ncbi:3-dehydroquinate synthase [Bacteroidales bacterium OttesenSCG-928-B11]|nr:3-dehydroquinate synthase [Bacteroidales bacterium OttesenSCG-928-B11]MDL2326686.1 3-dehydroquinate synthase [Bacteroidales bacterium OttesenSCG-928-A14]
MHKDNPLQRLLNKVIDSSPNPLFVIMDEKVSSLYGINDFNKNNAIHTYIFQSEEQFKTLERVSEISALLLREGFSKSDMLVNIGGGIVCDVGGFVAATYKRGMPLINIPTTLLAMIDAAHGGKNGVNLNGIKNSIGTIYPPREVLIDTDFLHTLPHEELLNGFGEMIKYALIADHEMWSAIRKINELNNNTIAKTWIDRCIAIKNDWVSQDLHDQSIRRNLNFGHTIGHALESYFFTQHKTIKHGHAVALGICFESYISYCKGFLTIGEVNDIKETISRFFTIPEIPESAFPTILHLLKQDKKNKGQIIYMTLLSQIGVAIPNQEVSETEILNAAINLFA